MIMMDPAPFPFMWIVRIIMKLLGGGKTKI